MILSKSPLIQGTLIHTGEVFIPKTSIVVQAYEEWQTVTVNDRTWVYFQEWWQEAYDLEEETDTVSEYLGYDTNIQVKDTDVIIII